MPYRLIATDLDGTLLNEARQISPRTRAVLAELKARGILVVPSTARPPRAIRALYEEMGLTGPVIAYNGALVYHPLTGQVLMHHPIPNETAMQVLAAIRQAAPDVNVGAELADEWHLDRLDERLDGMIKSGQVPAPPIFGRVEAAVATTERGVSKLYFIAPLDVRQALEASLQAEGLTDHVVVTSSGTNFVEIHAAGVSKGAALRALAATLAIPREATLALGDEENDIPLLQAAGLGIAMGNAPAPVRAAAGAVTLSNAEEGWAVAVERYAISGSRPA